MPVPLRHILDKPGRRRRPSAKERPEAARRTLLEFPQLIDYYIKLKEQHGGEAADLSAEKVLATEYTFIRQVADIQHTLLRETTFYGIGGGAYEEAHARVGYLKDVIENKGGHRLFYHHGAPVQREKDLQILYRLVWFGTPSDVGTEANDGRGPVDFKISRGAHDKTLVEMKLAKNTARAKPSEASPDLPSCKRRQKCNQGDPLFQRRRASEGECNFEEIGYDRQQGYRSN